jgi:hypothetical protein
MSLFPPRRGNQQVDYNKLDGGEEEYSEGTEQGAKGSPVAELRKLNCNPGSHLSTTRSERSRGPALAAKGLIPCVKHHQRDVLTSRPRWSAGLDAVVDSTAALHAQLLAHSSYRQGAIRRLPAAQLSASWLRQHGTFRPVLVPAAEGAAQALGLRLPTDALTPTTAERWLTPVYEVRLAAAFCHSTSKHSQIRMQRRNTTSTPG